MRYFEVHQDTSNMRIEREDKDMKEVKKTLEKREIKRITIEKPMVILAKKGKTFEVELKEIGLFVVEEQIIKERIFIEESIAYRNEEEKGLCSVFNDGERDEYINNFEIILKTTTTRSMKSRLIR